MNTRRLFMNLKATGGLATFLCYDFCAESFVELPFVGDRQHMQRLMFLKQIFTGISGLYQAGFSVVAEA